MKDKYAKDFLTIYDVEEQAVKNLNLPYEKVSGGFRLTIGSTAQVAGIISENSQLFNDFEVVKGRMDTVFLNVTGKKLEGDKK